MKIKILWVSIGLAFLSGCSATQSSMGTGQMQIKMAHLERKVDQKNQEIKRLWMKVESLSRKLDEINEPYEDDMDFEVIEDLENAQSSISKKIKDKKDNRIIRVAVSASQVQKALKNSGYYKGKIDGKIGSGSRKAIKIFQTDHGLNSDGIVGKKTWIELKNYLQ